MCWVHHFQQASDWLSGGKLRSEFENSTHFMVTYVSHIWINLISLGHVLIYTCHFIGIGHLTVEIRWSKNHLTSAMGFSILVRQHVIRSAIDFYKKTLLAIFGNPKKAIQQPYQWQYIMQHRNICINCPQQQLSIQGVNCQPSSHLKRVLCDVHFSLILGPPGAQCCKLPVPIVSSGT